MQKDPNKNQQGQPGQDRNQQGQPGQDRNQQGQTTGQQGQQGQTTGQQGQQDRQRQPGDNPGDKSGNRNERGQRDAEGNEIEFEAEGAGANAKFTPDKQNS